MLRGGRAYLNSPAMSASSLSVALLPCQCSPPACNSTAKATASTLDFASAFEGLPLNRSLNGSLFANYAPSFAALPHVGDIAPPLYHLALAALSFCSIAVFGSFQPALARTIEQPDEKILVFTHIPRRPFAGDSIVAEVSPDLVLEAPCLQDHDAPPARINPNLADKVHSSIPILAEARRHPFKKYSILADEDLQTLEKSSKFSHIKDPPVQVQDLFQISSLSTAEPPKPFLDFAGVFSPARANSLLNDIHALEAETGWRLRVITKSGSSSSMSGKDLKDLWKPDEKTIIVIEDLSSPNILNFNAGADVIGKLPRQFFLELQSRYGNQFYVQQEGEGAALMSTVQAIQECLYRPEGCKNVPGLTTDLYYLTLVTSIVGGCVFGFAARLPPSGRVEASWQWVVFLSPLWLLLFVSFGILPVVGRTSELEPLLKNAVGFCAGAIALYLTPIFGPSPLSKR